jgi:ABC-type transport system involved in multi-copper enzyme maturation permease subunit
MIGALVAAVRWDWFKLARRWMPWILLVILLLFSQLAVWTGMLTYQSLRRTGGTIPINTPNGRFASVSCKDLESGNASGLPAGTSPEVIQGLQAQCQQQQERLQQLLAEEYSRFALPGSIPIALNLGVSVGLILAAILTASHIGSEYGLGTLRTMLERGIGRWQFVASKLILLALVVAAALLLVIVATAGSSAAATHLAPAPGISVPSPTWGHALVVLVKSWVALVAFVLFAAFVTLLTRSTAAGMAIAIGYYLAELIIISILKGLLSWFDTAAHYLFGQNIAAWAMLALFGQSQASVSTLHAGLVLLVYSLVMGGLSFWLFQRRDIAGASSG